jgi:hypothetical protein
VAMQTPIRLCAFRSLTRVDRAATRGSAVGVGSSFHDP